VPESRRRLQPAKPEISGGRAIWLNGARGITNPVESRGQAACFSVPKGSLGRNKQSQK
jgi:hypothetical protein